MPESCRPRQLPTPDARRARRCARPARCGRRAGRAGPGRALAPDPRPQPCRRGRCRGSPRHWSVVTEERRPASRRTSSRRAASSADAHACSTCTVAGSWRRSSAWQVRYAARLADAIGARVVLPDYPLAPEHSWRDSFGTDHRPGRALGRRARRDRAGRRLVRRRLRAGRRARAARPRRPAADPPVLHAPWVDLTTSTPETDAVRRGRPVAVHRASCTRTPQWWAGSPDDLGRPEVSPALADLAGLPPALMFYGTRDLLAPGCRLLVRRAAEAGWDLTAVETPGLIHVYPLLPLPPRGAGGVRRRRWSSCAMTVRGAAFDELDAAHGVRRVAAAAAGVRRRAGLAVPRPRRPRPRAGHPPPAAARRTTTLVAYARVLDDGEWARIGRVRRGAGGARSRAGRPSWCGRRSTSSATARSGWTRRPGCGTGTRRTASSSTGPEFDEDGVIHVPMRRPRA